MIGVGSDWRRFAEETVVIVLCFISNSPTMARISSLLACWIALAALAEPSSKAGKDNVTEVIHMERPAYPFERIKSHIEGTGFFLLHVRADGSVESVDTVRSTGDPTLDGSAKAALLSWLFRPRCCSMNVKLSVTFFLKHGVHGVYTQTWH